MVATARDDQRPLWPFLTGNGAVLVLDVDPLWFDDRQTTNGGGVPTKYVCALAGGEVPNTDCPVRRTTDERVLRGC